MDPHPPADGPDRLTRFARAWSIYSVLLTLAVLGTVGRANGPMMNTAAFTMAFMLPGLLFGLAPIAWRGNSTRFSRWTYAWFMTYPLLTAALMYALLAYSMHGTD